MERWALVSGLGGDLEVYEQIQRELKTKRGLDRLFVLGDLIGPKHNNDALLKRLQQPQRGDLPPECIYGWWEEQLLAERGYRGDRTAEALRINHGNDAVEALLASVDTGHMAWLASLQFGFIELDCALLHGSSADVGDELMPSSSPLILLDRLTRLDVNRLFTARSTQQFRLDLNGGAIDSHIKDLNGEHNQQQEVPKRSVIGIGSGEMFSLYAPGSDHIEFVKVGVKPVSRGLGFG
ncbi:phosphoesterase [Synechococcus sp. UW140]|uniref:phosphoesterase n=1 Tax=Synechococcus sp. UW140 TaxID=368503 RepID=UPI000E0F0D72|nr:phosphoesterase [Synechococcus sp. UW140]